MNVIIIIVIIFAITLILLSAIYVYYTLSKQEMENVCKHKWKCVERINHYNPRYFSKHILYTSVLCSCEHCGVFKTFKVRGKSQ